MARESKSNKAVWSRTREAIDFLHQCQDVEKIKSELVELEDFLKALTPSKKTHYHMLDEWGTPIYKAVQTKLDEYGFVNGDREGNGKKPEVMLWWSIYGMISVIVWSPNLNAPGVAHHKASAHSRNEALIAELEIIIKS
ncbi:conserved hypothetical protein [Vibrio chagasii]|nr:conserved hypothetical protein [Vibrio chagasii]CAH7218984.1 conserved hypothetical protein [Vibrio chagasii]